MFNIQDRWNSKNANINHNKHITCIVGLNDIYFKKFNSGNIALDICNIGPSKITPYLKIFITYFL